MKINELIKAWQKQPSESLRALILAHDEREPLKELRELDRLKTAQVIERLEAFKGTKAKDPRLTRALEELISTAPWSADSSKPVWRAIFDATSRSADPRLKALKPAFKVRPTMQEWLGKQLANAVAELPDAFPSSDESKWRDALGALPAKKEKSGARDEAGLYAAVYANPDDDAPRLVLADFLTEKGDPRGEFITLQLGAGDEKREKALLKAHGKDWVSPIAPVLGVDVEWRRGFPAKGLVKFKAERDVQKYAALPEWSTFEELTWSTPGSGTFEQRQWYQYIGERFTHLRRANGPWLPQLLEAKTPWAKLEHLSVDFSNAKMLNDFLASKNFPALRSLGVSYGKPSWFAGVKVPGLETLHLDAHERNIEEWLPVAKQLGVKALWRGEMLELTPNARGVFSRATVHVPARLPQNWWYVVGAIPEKALEAIEIVGPGKLPPAEIEKLKAKVGEVKERVERAADALPEMKGDVHLCWLDETSVVTPFEGHLYVIDVSGAAPKVSRRMPADGTVAHVQLHPSGDLMALTYTGVFLLDPKTGATKREVRHPYAASSIIDLSEDGTRLSRGKQVFDLERGVAIEPPKGAKDDTRALDDSFSVRLVRGAPFEVRRPGVRGGTPLEGGERWYGMFTVPGGFVSCCGDGLVKWSAETGARLALLDSGAKPKERGLPRVPPCVSANRKFVAAKEPGTLVVATLPELKLVGRAKVKDPRGFAVSNDGRRLAVWERDGGLQVLPVS